MLHLLRFKQLPILKQLKLEEALLRTDERNFCIINEGSEPAIVMGISGKAEELIDPERLRLNPLSLIRRFSGGGTVIVDEQTLFVSFIFQKNAHPLQALYPEAILKWSGEIYRRAFNLPHFSLRENDYVIGDKKCGGNAQYIRKQRWIHHTTFLWDFHEEKMSYLLHPKKTPKYRAERSHLDFLCKLAPLFENREILIQKIISELSRELVVKEISFEDVKEVLNREHRRSTDLLRGHPALLHQEG